MHRAQKATHAITSFTPADEGFSASARTALKRLWRAYNEVLLDSSMSDKHRTKALYALAGAIRHLTYPAGKPARKVR